MNNKTFLVFSLIMLSVISLGYLRFTKHFNRKDIYEQKIVVLEEELLREEMKRLIAHSQLEIFKKDVAMAMPKALLKAPSGTRSYPLRKLASVVSGKKLESFEVRFAERMFEQAKEKFRAGQYQQAKEYFSKFVERNPFSINITEAYFLLAESHYKLTEFEKCVLVVEKMVQLFPESELTGYAMLRMGKIYEYQERPEDAVDLYKTVLKSFADRGIASQASQSLRSVDL